MARNLVSKKPETFKSITSALAKVEGGKSQANIGDVRQLFSQLSVMCVENPEVISVMIKTGMKKKNKS